MCLSPRDNDQYFWTCTLFFARQENVRNIGSRLAINRHAATKKLDSLPDITYNKIIITMITITGYNSSLGSVLC